MRFRAQGGPNMNLYWNLRWGVFWQGRFVLERSTSVMSSLGDSSADQNAGQSVTEIVEFLLRKPLGSLVRYNKWSRDQHTFLLLHFYHAIQWDQRPGLGLCFQILWNPRSSPLFCETRCVMDPAMLFATGSIGILDHAWSRVYESGEFIDSILHPPTCLMDINVLEHGRAKTAAVLAWEI